MPEDQVEVNDTTEPTETEESTEDNQEDKDQEQSNSEDKQFTDSFGNKYTADEFQEKFNEIQSGFTKKAQEASSFQKELDEIKKQSEVDARKSVDENESLKNVPPDVKEAIVSIVKPLLQEERIKIKEEEDQRKSDAQFKTELDDLEKEFDGKNGKPKFDKNVVIKAMKEPNNRIYDPREKFLSMNREVFNDLMVAEALKKQRGGNESEDTTGDHKKPEPHKPKTWQEARKASLSRFSNK